MKLLIYKLKGSCGVWTHRDIDVKQFSQKLYILIIIFLFAPAILVIIKLAPSEPSVEHKPCCLSGAAQRCVILTDKVKEEANTFATSGAHMVTLSIL